jgi:Protein of unknown function (DUF2589)
MKGVLVPTAIQSLQNIPFSSLIGGPLNATVQAQSQAAMTCIEFIERVGFTVPDPSKPNDKAVKEVTFKYSKLDDSGVPKTFNLSVPILAIVPIPYLRIDEVLIDFQAKLNDAVSNSDKSAFTGEFTAEASGGWGWGKASFRASASYKNEKSTTSSTTQDYCMSVKVRAVQAEVPGGMKRILDMLEAAVRETAA